MTSATCDFQESTGSQPFGDGVVLPRRESVDRAAAADHVEVGVRGVHGGGAVGRVGDHLGHSLRTCSTAGQKAAELEVDGGRVLGDAGEVGHHAHQVDLGDAPDGVKKRADLGRGRVPGGSCRCRS